MHDSLFFKNNLFLETVEIIELTNLSAFWTNFGPTDTLMSSQDLPSLAPFFKSTKPHLTSVNLTLYFKDQNFLYKPYFSL